MTNETPFLVLDETLIDKNMSTSSREGYTTRQAARAVVMDDDGKVALLHVKRDGYYKLPGGGIDEEEDPRQALDRELLEEIGSEAEVTHYLGTILEQRFYWNMTQLSYCYLARQIGEKGEPDFTEAERDAEFEVVWADSIETATKLIESATPDHDTELGKNISFMTQRDQAIVNRAKSVLSL